MTEQLQDTTPERLAKGPSIVVEGVRQMQDSLLERLAEKGHLYPDAGMNAALKVAGEKYYEDWYGAGFSGLQGIDYGKVAGGGGEGGVSQKQAKCRDSYRAARTSRGIGDRLPGTVGPGCPASGCWT